MSENYCNFWSIFFSKAQICKVVYFFSHWNCKRVLSAWRFLICSSFRSHCHFLFVHGDFLCFFSIRHDIDVFIFIPCVKLNFFFIFYQFWIKLPELEGNLLLESNCLFPLFTFHSYLWFICFMMQNRTILIRTKPAHTHISLLLQWGCLCMKLLHRFLLSTMTRLHWTCNVSTINESF